MSILFEFYPILAALFFFSICWIFGLEERLDHYLSGYEDGVIVERARPGFLPITVISAGGAMALVVLLVYFGMLPPLWFCVAVLLVGLAWWTVRMVGHWRHLRALRQYRVDVERWRLRQTAFPPQPMPVVDQPGAPRPPVGSN